MNIIKTIYLALLLSFFSPFSFAQAIELKSVPEPLKPWVDWVLYDQKTIDCPDFYNSRNHKCVWPSRLQLDLDNKGGHFTQQWQLFSESLIQLPGEADHWPLNVQSNGKELLVQTDNGTPYVTLPKGRHTIEGEFKWHKLPKSLYITPETGLVNLTVNNKNIEQVRFNQSGQLWLMQSDTEKVSKDNIDMQVFRRIHDGHPIQVETLITLRVSGKQRNSELNSVLLDGFIATEINSDLPARLEANNQLMLQLRPGEWTISVKGRAPSDVTSFTMPETTESWPQQEVWVFVSNNSMRQVQVGGVDSIDPNQTRLPSQWKGLPAYLLTPKQTLSLDVKERGITNISRNELNLNREMWLDFDGKGYSIKDSINGVIQQTRIDTLANIKLGQVKINEQPQLITRQAGKQESGVEIRQKNLNLTAESRFTGKHSELPVNGWATDLQEVNTHLHLPPGWSVLAVSGTDNLPNTWLEQWSLLDLFLVMIIVMSVRHFYGWRWAGLALTTLILTWQEGGAPNIIWFNLLAVTALLKALAKHKHAHLLEKYRLISFAALAMILLSYTVNTVRTSVYPQLERGYTQQWQSARQLEMEYKIKQARSTRESSLNTFALSDDEYAEEIVVTGTRSTIKTSIPNKRIVNKKQIKLKQIDPNSQIQSGPGLPSWNGYQSIHLSWAGPVEADQTSKLILLSPRVNLVINLLGIFLLICLSWCFLNTRFHDEDDGSDKQNTIDKIKVTFKSLFKSSSVTAAILLALMLSSAMPESAQAQTIPDDDLLDELKERLTQRPNCQTDCAQIQKMAVSATSEQLQLRLRIHALTNTAIPLPASNDTWLPNQVLLNGAPATALFRDSEQAIWLSVKKGAHDIVLRGPMAKRVSFPLPLPLKPNFATWGSKDNSWTIEGINNDGVASTQLQFTRIISEDNQQNFQSDHNILPTFVKINRQLRLGLDWYVETTVTRISPENVPLNINIPLLSNEQLLDDQLTVTDGQVALNFTTNQSTTSWSSKLLTFNELVLTAADNPNFLEVWSIDASPIWRTETEGLSINGYSSKHNQYRSVPIWQPWPGEKLTLKVDRPEGIAGQTVTIQGSYTHITVGKRANDISLNLNIRSSRGVQHQIKLPENADVQELLINDIKQRVQVDNSVLNVTLKPGKQDLIIKWREQHDQDLHYTSPAIDLGLASVNAHTSLKLPRDRWVVWADGPVLGPAILFWSVLGVLLIISIALGWSKITPLNGLQWFLLAVGLSQTEPTLIAVVITCFIGLSLREKVSQTISRWKFNLMQIGLMFLIFSSISIILGAVANGLLGSPDMQISGNGSNAYFLKWYQDRAVSTLPQADIISVPLWVYRILMLAWAMWLAMSLLKWIKWGWLALSSDGFWKGKQKTEISNDTEKSLTED